MLDNFITHNILRILYKRHKNSTTETTTGNIIPVEGYGLSILDIQRKSHINVEKIEDICESLLALGFINKIVEDTNFKNHIYSINKGGIKALFSWYFLHRTLLFLKGWIPVVLSLIATGISIATYSIDSTNRKESKYTIQQVQSMQEQLDSLKYVLKQPQQSVQKE